VNCIRDADRLAVHRSDSDSVRADDRARSSHLSSEPLRDWIEDRLHRGDIAYQTTVNGITVFTVLRPLYEESEHAAADTEQ
jgi:hypothetical protein